MSGRCIAIIGASPHGLTEAVYRAQVDRDEVVVYDVAGRVGGAWATASLFGYDNVELGCHYLSRSRLGYRFLRETLGVELEPTTRHFIDLSEDAIGEPADAALVPNDDPRRLARVVLTKARSVGSAVLALDGRELRYRVRRLTNAGPFLYPSMGCGEIVDRLVRAAESAGVEFRTARVERIDADVDAAIVAVEGTSSKYDRVVLGQAVDVPIYRDAAAIEIRREPVLSVHFVLHLDGRKAQDFCVIQNSQHGYHWLDDRAVFFRITDVGRYFRTGDARPPNGHMLICCQVSALRYTPDMTGADVLGMLVELGLIDGDTTLLDSRLDIHHGSMILHDDFDAAVARLPGSVRIMRTWDLTFGFEEYFRRWSKIRIVTRPSG